MQIEADWLSDRRTQDVMAAIGAAGHRVLAVGGCVRNTLLGVPVSDIDLATSATPDETTGIAEAAGFRAVATGAAHGTITVICRGLAFEVTTFRRDVETDGRRAVVAFTGRLEEDARRRDFTMNALYAEADGTLCDPLGGLGDLKARRLRFIDDAGERIREDYLRSLRFFRFHAQYGDPAAGLDPAALDAIAAHVDGLASLPGERIGAEMRKLLTADDPAPALAAMQSTGGLAAVLPGASPVFVAPLVHLEGLAGQPAAFVRRLVALGGEEPKRRLKLTRAETVLRNVLLTALSEGTDAGEIAYRHGAEVAWDVLLLRGAFSGDPVPDGAARNIATGAGARFPVSADDLMPDLSGKALGQRLKALERDWIASGFTLDRAALLTGVPPKG